MSKSATVKIRPTVFNKPGSQSGQSSNTTLTTIQSRRSKELIIGLCGSVGSGVKELRIRLEKVLESSGYHVVHIRLSHLIAELEEKLSKTPAKELLALKGYARYTKFQDLGDKLRKDYNHSILAELAIRKIRLFKSTEENATEKTVHPVAYIIDQLKHPAEIKLFQAIYRNNFYLIGLLMTTENRETNLEKERLTKQEILSLIERDRKGGDEYGQQVAKSLHLSDFFIKRTDKIDLATSVSRFVNLVHGIGNLTPTFDETGMYFAHSASLRSSCLSRQVGAAILNNDGEVLSTGCNDVPKFAGGLYSVESKIDGRCFNSDIGCHNDKYKDHLKDAISDILKNNENLKDDYEKIAKDIADNTKISDLIEYSRAVHAEMDAITTLSRSSTASSIGNILYSTTYPCHGCAKHIIAAGIKRVVYIEPYDKSLALKLHGDAIVHLDNFQCDVSNKVCFESFEGVSPLRYMKFFMYNNKRKSESGKPIEYSIIDSNHVDPQYLDSYTSYEVKVIEELEKKLNLVSLDLVDQIE